MVAHTHQADSLWAHRAGNRARMWAALAINIALLLATAVGGILTDSLALLAEAGHLVSDVGAIAIGLLAARLALIDPTPARTFGLKRSEVVGALVNGIALVVVSFLILVQAISRLSDPPEVGGTGVLVLGLLSLAGNVAATMVLASGARSDINLEGVLRHSASDALSALGVVLAGVVVLGTGWDLIDPLISILISILIAAGSWRLLKEPFEVLMEAAPAGIDVRSVGEAMASDPDIVEIHDLHVWTVTSGFPALSAHLVVKAGADRDLVRGRIEELLHGRFGVHHTTLQVVEATRTTPLISVEDMRRPGEGPSER
jgi:cobalt-zinc-cadmium efflux system protein